MRSCYWPIFDGIRTASEPQLRFHYPEFLTVLLQYVSSLEQLRESLLVVCRFLILLGHDYFSHPGPPSATSRWQRNAPILLRVPRDKSHQSNINWGGNQGIWTLFSRGICGTFHLQLVYRRNCRVGIWFLEVYEGASPILTSFGNQRRGLLRGNLVMAL